MEAGKPRTFRLPAAISDLVSARNKLRAYYREVLHRQGSDVELSFTLDGNLIGDLGEAIAVELLGIKLVETKSAEGIDGYAPDGKTTVQIKATGTGRGPAFRRTERRADHLIFLDLNLETSTGEVVYNGPEHIAMQTLPKTFVGQREVSRSRIRAADSQVVDSQRLRIIAVD